MILRRLAQHVKDQNWFAIGLEFLIVVFGVFIGIQVSNWNEAKQDRHREAEYLQRLHADVEAAEAGRLNLDERVTERVANADRVSAALYGEDMTITELDTQACESISRLHIFYMEGYALPTLEELVASGRLGVIRDQRLLQSLSDYLSFARSLPFRAEAISSRAPILPQEFPAVIALRSLKKDGVSTSASRCDFAAMQADPAFLNAFTEVRERANFFQSNLLAPESALLDRIHIELDRVLGFDHIAEAGL